jgi:SAM-dependent methyltransferase
MTSSATYKGTDNLEAMLAAHRYNAFLVNLITGIVLDFGAGIGTYARTFTQSPHTIVCVEPDDELRSTLQDADYEVHASIHSVPDNSCDFIYSLNVLEHIEDDQGAAAELYRTLKPGAKCLIYVPALQILYSAMDSKVGHYRRYDLKGLKSVLCGAGFTIVQAEYADSLGFIASIAYKYFGNDDGSLNTNSLKLYDSLIFPLSRILDTVTHPFFGKNIFALIHKPSDNCGS